MTRDIEEIIWGRQKDGLIINLVSDASFQSGPIHYLFNTVMVVRNKHLT